MNRTRRSSSIYDIRYKSKDGAKEPTFLRTKRYIFGFQVTLGNIIGALLSLVTLLLQCIACSTAHWKEISPNVNSLYIDGVDALIRTEVLIYFDSVHRSTRQSYGLFQRCEYLPSNASKSIHERKPSASFEFRPHQRTCTKNFLPSFDDEHFDECHSLQYYRFCSKTSEKIFDINNDYLRATFDLASALPMSVTSKLSCNCHYPGYVRACQILSIISLLCLLVTCVLFTSFAFARTRHRRMKIKCFGLLAAFLASVFMTSNLITALSFLEYESIEYLTTIERHYRSKQIYKLSQDTKLSIERFLSSIDIHVGYSTILAWIALATSLVDAILFMTACEVKHYYDGTDPVFLGIAVDSDESSQRHDNADNPPSISLVPTTAKGADTSSLLPTIVITDTSTASKPQPSPPLSCLKRSPPLRAHFEDEV